MTLSQSTTHLRCVITILGFNWQILCDSTCTIAHQVDMIRDLVLYFLKQGPYDGAGDIAVLCAYLGQLQKVRAALRDLKVAVSVDERDEEQLERTGLTGDEEIGFAQVQVARHVSKIIRFENPLA